MPVITNNNKENGEEPRSVLDTRSSSTGENYIRMSNNMKGTVLN